METKNNEREESSEELEKYRFIFLRYLEILTEMLELDANFEAVDRVKTILDDGWRFNCPEIIELQGRAAIEAEKFLYSRYDLEHSVIGCKKAVMQFFADYSVTANQEERLWHSLVASVNKINFANKNEDEIWFSDDAEGQRLLMSGDDLSHNRILHYQKELQKMGEKPLSPNQLETVFRFKRNGLIHLAPFASFSS